MLFAIDIDGTIAARNVRKFIELCNERFALGLSADILQRRMPYRDFLQLPELIERKEDLAFKRELVWLDLDPQLLVAMRPLPGAIDILTQLAQRASVTYYTARYSTVWLERNAPMQQATKEWLAKKQFPSSDAVVFCSSVPDKLTRLAAVAQTQPVVLIDDQYQKLLSAFAQLDISTRQVLQENLHLVAFGATSLPEQCYGLQVDVLPCWNDLDCITERMEIFGSLSFNAS
jgi:uncharacterized HAD superfamily protein